MTIDERLDRLTERHEALAQSLEIIAGMQRENERQFAETDRRFAETDRRFAETDGKIRTLTEVMAGLVEIVRRHEERLDGLDSR